jgi:hypothetical protein
MRKAYTWPNDPQVYGGDAPLYRIVFAPGGTNVPITPSVHIQRFGRRIIVRGGNWRCWRYCNLALWLDDRRRWRRRKGQQHRDLERLGDGNIVRERDWGQRWAQHICRR